MWFFLGVVGVQVVYQYFYVIDGLVFKLFFVGEYLGVGGVYQQIYYY